MKKIYITVLLIFAVSVFLFIISFVYLDRHNHIIFYYNISLDGQYVGTAKVDKFITEDKLIYRSVSRMPFSELFTEKRIRMNLDKKYNLEDYQKQLFANGGSYLFYAENKSDSVSFMERSMSRFIFLTKVPIRKGAFVFEEDSPVAYLPILENYDFKRGRSQGFTSIIYLPDNSPLPVKRFVTLTSIKDEYLKIGHRKIKTENLLLKIKGLPPGSVWVAKSDRSLIMIEIPATGLKITRSFKPKEAAPKKRLGLPEGYISKDVTFQNKNKQISGTLTIPLGTAPADTSSRYPAVLLIWGSGPQDRNYQGFFESIADYLSKCGYCVLRLDKRGIGSSSGDSLSVTQADEFDDITAALGFLKAQNNVKTDSISVIAHSEGTFNALRLAAENPDVKGVVLMAPLIKLEPQDAELILRARAVKEKWDDEYLKSMVMALRETKERAGRTKRDWGYIMGKRCYLKAVREESETRPMEVIEKVSASILILHGKNDAEVPVEYAGRLDKALSDHGKMRHSITYFDYLGHFFGKLNNDGISKMHYNVDKEALAAIRDWLNLNTAEPVKAEEKPPATP